MHLTRLVLRTPLFAALVLLAATPLLAGMDVEFGSSVRLDDRGEIYVAVASRYFGPEREAVQKLAVRYNDPDDLAVALFIGQKSGRSQEEVSSLFDRGLSWWDVAFKLKLDPSIWFVDVDGEPDPPYARAYHFWDKHRENPRYVLALTDDDIRNLVAARMIHEYFDLPVEDAMRIRAVGDNLRYIIAEQYVERHERRTSTTAEGPTKPATSQGMEREGP